VLFQDLARELSLAAPDVRVAIQGFGQVGASAAVAFTRLGCRVVAISDAHSAAISPGGFDLELLERLRLAREPAAALPGEAIAPDDLLDVDADVLILAALGGMIDESNVDRVTASIVLEGANGPVTPAAEAVLTERGIVVVPDILANAGGVVVSYFEWVQNLQRLRWSATEVDQRLTEMMSRAWGEVSAVASRHRLDLRGAAYRLAVHRVAEAMAMRRGARTRADVN
jgi:glutamate dehydrogenase/leucine dehydrogenase